ncbi:uncharacterized protein PHALS_14551 [Plasmopara halstedii]|uniref:Uncharacterized protein n=1 Tax=Plasmopara halstedii TaxID=4781 RepID=A0A0P1AJZ2_PLAHL|nr:uncharacterized protein PHALS_14551 [Plasmopara halstedii]CEG41684.1 hypothetical protein PHALS_14551 [Plasmopara halstedii]|eukprot:XP_024578053.1 hypothetical protein PHALS_14551 [Plasmopara halstedii]
MSADQNASSSSVGREYQRTIHPYSICQAKLTQCPISIRLVDFVWLRDRNLLICPRMANTRATMFREVPPERKIHR